MGIIVGVVIGYAMGTRAGQDGWSEFSRAWRSIRSSPEVRDLLAGGFSVAGQLMASGGERLSDLLTAADQRTLRPAA